jgi:hypothetical protein
MFWASVYYIRRDLKMAFALLTVHVEQWFPNFFGPPPPWFHKPIPSAPYPIKSILQNSGLHDTLRKIITIKFKSVTINCTFIQTTSTSSAPLGNPTAPQGAVQPTLETTL